MLHTNARGLDVEVHLCLAPTQLYLIIVMVTKIYIYLSMLPTRSKLDIGRRAREITVLSLWLNLLTCERTCEHEPNVIALPNVFCIYYLFFYNIHRIDFFLFCRSARNIKSVRNGFQHLRPCRFCKNVGPIRAFQIGQLPILLRSPRVADAVPGQAVCGI